MFEEPLRGVSWIIGELASNNFPFESYQRQENELIEYFYQGVWRLQCPIWHPDRESNHPRTTLQEEFL